MQSIAHGQMIRRTVSLRTALSALLAAPFLLAALPVRAEETPGPVTSYVSGLAPDDLLNVRATPSPIGKTEARLPVGSPVKNFGCAEVNGNPWCKVEQVDNPQVRGWAPARYLNPASAVVLTDTDAAFPDQPGPTAALAAAAPPVPEPDLKARLGEDAAADPEAPKSADAIGKTAMQDAYGLAFAIVQVERGRWTMDVRANRGYQLVWVGTPFVAIRIGMTQHLPMAARVVALIFAALGPYAVLKWRRTVRARFAEAAQELSSGQVAEVRAAAKTL